MTNEELRQPVSMFRLKPLKSNTIPFQWVVIYFDGVNTVARYYQYRKGCWAWKAEWNEQPVTVLNIADMVRSKEICWVVGNGMYPWLCHQGLYEQFTAGIVSLPMGRSSSSEGKLTGQF